MESRSSGVVPRGRAHLAEGHALDRPTRSFLENRFGYDFGHVRIHASGEAARSALDLETRAYTLGADIAFAPGVYAPQSRRGLNLLAHEALHTLQAASQGTAARETPIAVTEPGDRAERHVHDAMHSAVRQPEIGHLERPTILRAPPDDNPLDLGVGLAQDADPLMAAMLGSEVIDGFVFGHSEITPGQRPTLESLARRIPILLDRYPESKIHIVGHTDAVDTEAKNEALGQQRADATLAALSALGVSAEMDASSMGKRQLLVASPGPNARNRRAEIQFVPAGRQHPVIPITPPAPPISGGGARPDLNITQEPPPPIITGGPEKPDIFKPLPKEPEKKSTLPDPTQKVPWELKPVPGFIWDIIKSGGKQGSLKWTIPPKDLPWWLQ